MAITVNRAVLALRLFTGLSRHHLAYLAVELAVPWQAVVEGRRHAARGGVRKRAAGAGGRQQLVFVDRRVATLIHLRHDLPHSVLELLFGVDRSAVARAIGEMRTLLAERGCAVPDRPGLRLRTLTDVFAYARAEGVELRLDATEVQVRRPPGRPRRTTRVRLGQEEAEHNEGHRNRPPAGPHVVDRCPATWPYARRHGGPHEGVAVCFRHFPDIEVLLDDGYPGLSRDHRGQAITPPRKPCPGALPGSADQWERDRHRHPYVRITVAHALADHKRWKQLQRWTQRCDRLPDTYRAIAGMVSDRNITA